MIQHEEELYRTLDLYGISRGDVCIVGSGVIARAGFRKNNDLDIALRPSARKILVKKNACSASALINLSENIQACTGRYSVIGINDDALFGDECSECYNGMRIAKLELEIASKLRRLKPQDQKDLADIGNASGIHNFDWGRIFYLAYFNGERLPDNSDAKVSLIRRAARRIKRAIKRITPQCNWDML